MSALIEQAAEWAVQLYEERTIELAKGKGDIYSTHPAYRVSWHEITYRFPEINGPNDRVDFQPEFDKRIKKRKLWQVLQGKEKADQWYQRVKS